MLDYSLSPMPFSFRRNSARGLAVSNSCSKMPILKTFQEETSHLLLPYCLLQVMPNNVLTPLNITSCTITVRKRLLFLLMFSY